MNQFRRIDAVGCDANNSAPVSQFPPNCEDREAPLGALTATMAGVGQTSKVNRTIASLPAIAVNKATLESEFAAASGLKGHYATQGKRTGDMEPSDNESPTSRSHTPKEPESPRFQALLRMTEGGKSKTLKSFSHELGPKGVSLHDSWRPQNSNDLEEILVALRSRFNSVKEEVNSELQFFAGHLVDVLENKECFHPSMMECVEDLLVLARKCATMSPTDFRQTCELIVQELDDRRQELPIGILRQLHTRMLFILTRCTRLLQFEKQSGLDENMALPQKLGQVPCINTARSGKPSRRASFNERVVFSKQGLNANIFTHHSTAESSRRAGVPRNIQKVDSHDGSMGTKQEIVIAQRLPPWNDVSNQQGMSLNSCSVVPQRGNDKPPNFRCKSIVLSEVCNNIIPNEDNLSRGINVQATGPLQKHQKLISGNWGDQSKILQENRFVICRICEDNIPGASLEAHSRMCAYADRCDHKTLSTDERLLRLGELLQRFLDSHNKTGLAMAAEEPKDESISVDNELDYRMGSFGLRENSVEAPSGAHDVGEGQMPLQSEHDSTSVRAAPSLDRVSNQTELWMADRIHLLESDDVNQIIELADIARCVGNTRVMDGGALEYIESCMQDLQEVLQQRKAAALTVHTFGRRIQRLVRKQWQLAQQREKYLTTCDAGELSSSEEPDADGHFEEDIFRSTPVRTEYKDRTTIDDFEIIKPISRGAFGRVFLARKRTTGDLFAIKVLRKSDMMRKNAVESVQAERNILISVRNPFVVRFFYSFTCKDNLYLVMEYLNGGDLYSMLRNLGCLEEDMARVYIAELVLALEYLHSLGVVHRDLKPDNLLIAHDGHLKLTDFGLSRVGLINSTEDLSGPGASTAKQSIDRDCSSKTPSEISQEREQRHQRSAVGTPDYLAPEILLGTGHGYTADWWSTGVILFECLTGFPPFNAQHPQIIFDNILNRNIPWPCVPEDMSFVAQDLIDRFLTWDPSQRLGAKGAGEVKAHPFFKDIHWDTLARQKAAFIPSPDSAHDTSYFTSRHIWNSNQARVFPDRGVGDSSECGSSSGDSSSTLGSGREDQGDQCRDLEEFEITPSIRYSFSGFSFKNLSQLASINIDLLQQSGKGSKLDH